MRLQDRHSFLLTALRAGRQTAHKLAKQLSVTIRTIYRDIQRLRQAGHKIHGVFGPNGGFLLTKHSRPAPVVLTTNEIRELALAALACSGPQLTEPLIAALPVDAATELRSLIEHTHIEDPVSPTDTGQLLAAISTSLSNRQMLRFNDPKPPPREYPPTSPIPVRTPGSHRVAALGLARRNSEWVLLAMDWFRLDKKEIPLSHLQRLGLTSWRFRGPIPTTPSSLPL